MRKPNGAVQKLNGGVQEDPAPRSAAEWADIQQRFYDGGATLELQGGACRAHNGTTWCGSHR